MKATFRKKKAVAASSWEVSTGALKDHCGSGILAGSKLRESELEGDRCQAGHQGPCDSRPSRQHGPQFCSKSEAMRGGPPGGGGLLHTRLVCSITAEPELSKPNLSRDCE